MKPIGNSFLFFKREGVHPLTKDSLIRGTLVLTLAAFISRFLGVFQKLPLNYMLLSDVGTYGIAFNIYSLILIVATAGIPSALSKTVSAKLANGCEKEARELYASAILYAILIGFLAALLLYIAAPLYASWIKSPSAVSSIRAIAPTLLFFPLIAIMRGHFQARQHMTPNAISQIVEQIFRVASSLLLAWVFLSVNTNAAAAGASFGAVVGGIGALFIMVFYSKKMFPETSVLRTLRNTKRPHKLKYFLFNKSFFHMIILTGLPIVIYSMAVTVIYTIDTSTIISLLHGQMGLSDAADVVSVYTGIAQPIAGLPVILAIALSQTAVPIISSNYSLRNMEIVSRNVTKVYRISIITGLPMVLLLCITAFPISGIFNFGGVQIGVELAPRMMILMVISAFFQILMQTSGAILTGTGRMRLLIWSVLFGVLTKIIGNLILAPKWGIDGIMTASILAFLVMSLLNYAGIRLTVSFRIYNKGTWFKLALLVLLTLPFFAADNMLGMEFGFLPYCIVFGVYSILFLLLFIVYLIIAKAVSKGLRNFRNLGA